ncbi:MAG: heme ABC exporter ATP-binding protein CcmA [Gemmatimonadaceae bacterium]
MNHALARDPASAPSRFPGASLPARAGIRIEGLGRRFGFRWILRGVTLAVAPGQAIAILGANGSGKSTLLRVVGTLLKPNAGSVTVSGLDIERNANGVRRQLGYLAHAAGIYDDLTARENLEFAADMLGEPRESVAGVLYRIGLASVADQRARGFSAGMQRRLALGRLILRKPSVLLLDEPYSNLDADGVTLMNSVVADTIDGGGVAMIALHELAPARGVLHGTFTLVNGRVGTRLTDIGESMRVLELN